MSKIEWTDETWNPLSGCTKISAGCRNCYAADIAKRFWGGREFSDIEFHHERLEQPLRWRKPRMVFVNSMSDLFHESVSFDDILKVFMVMRQAKAHTFQVLTKRPDRMRLFMQEWYPHAEALANMSLSQQTPPENVWLGVTCENQKAASERIPVLQKTPAAVRFVSFEPLLERISLHSLHQFQNIDWGIIGGESGPKARKCDVDWIEDLADRHSDYGVACFVKQLGSKPVRGGKKYAARGKGQHMEDWPESLKGWRYFPEQQKIAS